MPSPQCIVEITNGNNKHAIPWDIGSAGCIVEITNGNNEHAIPWDIGSAGKTCINYAGIQLWNVDYNLKSWASSRKSHGRASVKRKKFVNPVQQHKSGCGRGKRTSFICAWRVPAERILWNSSTTPARRQKMTGPLLWLQDWEKPWLCSVLLLSTQEAARAQKREKYETYGAP